MNANCQEQYVTCFNSCLWTKALLVSHGIFSTEIVDLAGRVTSEPIKCLDCKSSEDDIETYTGWLKSIMGVNWSWVDHIFITFNSTWIFLLVNWAEMLRPRPGVETLRFFSSDNRLTIVIPTEATKLFSSTTVSSPRPGEVTTAEVKPGGQVGSVMCEGRSAIRTLTAVCIILAALLVIVIVVFSFLLYRARYENVIRSHLHVV